MMFGDYFIEFDRTGFPLINKKSWDYSISLFPISKYQFERFMIAKGPKGSLYTDKWYRTLLELNPRRPWKMCNTKPWELFITGASDQEIFPFIHYLGKAYRLPKVREWKELLKSSRKIKKMKHYLKEFCKGKSSAPVLYWIERGIFPLVEEGFLEIVFDKGRICYMGKPYQGLLPNTWNPESIREINWELCRKAVGFRIVKDK